jgi:hypothetical protein
MSGTANIVDEVALSGTGDGKITIMTILEPYGEGSESVASIGVSLQKNAKDPDWKVHIPKENIDMVIAALQKAKESL